MSVTDNELDALEQLSPKERRSLERAATTHVEAIERELLIVLARHREALLSIEANPRYARWITTHTVVQLAGKLMLAALVEEGEEARPKIAAMVDHLQLFVAPRTSSRARTN